MPELLRLQTAAPEAAQWSTGALLEGLAGCVVAEAGDAVVGFLLYRDLPGDEREILNVAVDPERRRQGVASRLLAVCLFEFRGEAHLEVRESNAAARALYGRFGFTDIAVRRGYYHRPVEDAVVMKRPTGLGFVKKTVD